ncbi:PQQ-binding-like beta-propeller repeat protein [Citricoccus sp.]|uniref:PQQ-binding-like beta-propeller repeat protein n=1 Tax=Citricoccus sp. TaxID=1978372 RepID=UPI0028BEDCAC|nr:PQQ-binding-like beta-propeller repeat protein [Citricoccus sp.]
MNTSLPPYRTSAISAGTHPAIASGTSRTPHTRRALSVAAVAAVALALSACAPGAGAGGGDSSAETAGDSATAESTDGADAAEPVNAAQRDSRAEVPTLSPRVVLSHDGGLVTLDGETGEIVHEEELDGFLRLNNAGDGQHVMVSNGDQFEVYNSGIDAQGHGDHFHYYESDPGLSGIEFAAPYAGHVVVHHGLTTLFGDGDGSIQTFTSEHLKDGQPRTESTATDDPHHGVALQLIDGTLLTTQGTEEGRNTVQVKSTGDNGEVLAETTDCTGVHGEAAAAPNENGDVVVLGCEDGPVIYRDGEFHKVAAENEYQRTGNLAGSEDSSVMLGDLKTDAEAEFERPTQVALIDTLTDSLQTVDLGSSYWFRSLARGPEGEALVLTYDGELNVIDEETGEITAEIPAIEPWEEKEEWQQPGPIVKVADSMAYVTDAENQQLVVIDLESGEVAHEFDLEVTPVEMAVVTGHPEAPEHEEGAATAEHEEEATDEEGHEGHDH